MSAPTPAVRAVMMQRDAARCVRCAIRYRLEAQHRQATGMGGNKVKPTVVELLTLCSNCNTRAESDLQTVSLAFGWKVRRWVSDCALVPVRYPWFGRGWFRLTAEGLRVPMPEAEAVQMMHEVYGDEYETWLEEVPR